MTRKGAPAAHGDSSAPRAGAARVGPFALLLPFLALVAGVLYMLDRPPGTRVGEVELSFATVTEVAGFEGLWEARDGTRLSVRLTPLHAEPEHQSFDVDALRRRAGLGQGEPWRLELAWVDPSRSSTAGPVTLGSLAIEDALGQALHVLPNERSGTAVDPLRTLLEPPAEGLAPGHAVQLFLWGRAPEGRPHLVGWAGDGELPPELALEPSRIEPTHLPRFLARRDVEKEPAADGSASEVESR